MCGTPENEAARLRRLLPEPYVLLESVAHDVGLDPAHPGELAQVESSATLRRLDYLAGRHCARRLLARLGVRDFALRRASDGAPLWPRNVVGTILHHHEGGTRFSAAAVAPRECCAGLGIDAEACRPLPGCVWPIVFVPGELAMLEACPAAARGLLARLLFSAKHAAKKAFQPLLGKAPGYQLLRLHPLHSRGVYVLRFGRHQTWRTTCEVRFSLLDKPSRHGELPTLMTTVVLPPGLRCQVPGAYTRK